MSDNKYVNLTFRFNYAQQTAKQPDKEHFFQVTIETVITVVSKHFSQVEMLSNA